MFSTFRFVHRELSEDFQSGLAQRRLFDLYGGVVRKVFDLGGGWVISNRTSTTHTFEMLYFYS